MYYHEDYGTRQASIYEFSCKLYDLQYNEQLRWLLSSLICVSPSNLQDPRCDGKQKEKQPTFA